MSRHKIKNDFELSAKLNNFSFTDIYSYFIELALARFKYENMPDTIDVRFLELTLLTEGAAVFFEDEELGYLALKVAWQNGFTVYQTPLQYRAYATNGYQMPLDITDSVIIWNNYLHTPSAARLKYYALRLYNLDRIIDVNANAQKTPVLVTGEESEMLTLKNLYKEFDGNAPVIYGYKTLSADGLTVLKTDAPYVADKIYELRTQIWNECLTYLGIPNLTLQKKERVISDEVARSQGGTLASRFSVLEARKEAVDKINKMFGLDIKVEFRDTAEGLDVWEGSELDETRNMYDNINVTEDIKEG